MTRLLQSPVTVMTVAALMFFTTLWFLLRAVPLGQPVPEAKALPLAEDDPSWKFRNPDIDQWVSQIKSERDTIAVREQQLKEWESRLVAESREIASVTQAVSRTQSEFDRRVLLFTEQQKDNAKKQLKVIADMTPDGAAALLNEKPDDDAARLLYTLKPDLSAAILDAMCKQGGPSAKRAALLTDRIKDILQIPTNNPNANVSR